MTITEKICNKIYEEYSFIGEQPSYIDTYDDLHDIIYLQGLNNIYLEGTVYMIDKDGEIYNEKYNKMKKEINEFIEKEFTSYYGDIGFSSQQDYNSFRY